MSKVKNRRPACPTEIGLDTAALTNNQSRLACLS
ncbi:MAG: hypothetical protein ACI9ND_003350 [Yoonia sp.]